MLPRGVTLPFLDGWERDARGFKVTLLLPPFSPAPFVVFLLEISPKARRGRGNELVGVVVVVVFDVREFSLLLLLLFDINIPRGRDERRTSPPMGEGRWYMFVLVQ